MSAVETLRDIPVIVEHRKGCKGDVEPMDFDYDYCSGFPFDNSGRRTRDPLEDIAQRHPEFAQHLQGFPRRQQRSGGDQDQDEFLRRRFERPFSTGRFERFGFPFDRDDFEREPQRYYEAYPEYFENFQNQNPQTPPHNNPQSPQQQYQQNSPQANSQGYQQYPPQYSQQYQPQYNQQSQDNQQSSQHPPQYQSQPSHSVSQGTQTDEAEAENQQQEEQQQTELNSEEQKVESGQTRGRPIQQSNTCDLSQHQPPDEALNEREQRSMSAPPENKRFTSSVNIPMGGLQENNSPPATGAKSQTGSGSTERVIPIHVEGRDDPVVPKNFSGPPPTHSQHHQQPQPERIFSDSPRPTPETIFGRRPDAFTQFVHREPHSDWPPSFGSFPDEFNFRQSESPNRFAGAKPQSHYQQPQQQFHKQEATTQANVEKPQSQEQRPNTQQETAQQPPKQQPPPKQPLGPIEQIQAIQKDVSTLLRQVEAFNGIPKDKNYLYLDEMLTRNLLKLDNVDTQGQDSIRSARKEAIKCIERAIGLLEAKAAANVAPKTDKMEVEQPQEGIEKMEIESTSTQEPTTMEMSPPVSQNEVSSFQEDNTKSEKAESTEQQQSKSAENVGTTEKEVKDEEIKSENSQKSENIEEPSKSQSGETLKDSTSHENKESGEVTGEIKEGEKKEKKKIKKKVNKEDKDKKQ